MIYTKSPLVALAESSRDELGGSQPWEWYQRNSWMPTLYDLHSMKVSLVPSPNHVNPQNRSREYKKSMREIFQRNEEILHRNQLTITLNFTAEIEGAKGTYIPIENFIHNHSNILHSVSNITYYLLRRLHFVAKNCVSTKSSLSVNESLQQMHSFFTHRLCVYSQIFSTMVFLRKKFCEKRSKLFLCESLSLSRQFKKNEHL